MSDQEKDLCAISLFTGAGGLDIGLEQAGFATVSATDLDADCISSLRANQEKKIAVIGRPRHKYLEQTKITLSDISELRGGDLIPDGADSAWTPDLLTGGPPCQPFSSSGKQLSVLDKRGRLFEEFVRVAGELRPKVILFENVRGLVTARGPGGEPGEVLSLVRKSFEEIGYVTRFGVLNAADFGCPQRRVRLFMMATRKHVLPDFPAPSHAKNPDSNFFGMLKPWVTLGRFQEKTPRPNPDEIVRPREDLARLLAEVPTGKGLKSPGRKEATRPGGHWGYKQGTFIADPGLPARTVTAASTQDWIRGKDGSLRRLTLRECAGLQGFPEDWEFKGSTTSRFRQVGNAVPPVFGKILGRQIIRALEVTIPARPQKSAPFPDYMGVAIAYTRKDHERNRASRTRAKMFAQG